MSWSKQVEDEDWQVKDASTVREKIAWLRDKPTGIVYEKRSKLHRIVLQKDDDAVLRMYFADPLSHGDELITSGAMSAIQLDDPFDLAPTPYNQAMMLTLTLNPHPERVYVAGFAGGRIPLVLHHYLPSVVIDSTDIDGDVAQIAERFFGVEFDDRQRLYIEDGRQFLEQLSGSVKYDIIFVDVFRGLGFSPPQLATTEFYEICNQHLSPGGVVVANTVESDPLFKEKIATIMSCFTTTYIQVDRTVSVFGTNQNIIPTGEIVGRAEEINARYQFPYDYVGRAHTLTEVNHEPNLSSLLTGAGKLTDSTVPTEDLAIPRSDPLFYNVGRNDPCPCGSDKKFKLCHGR